MLVIEGNASGDTAGMSILTANDEFGVIHFGDGDDVDVGKIEYSHSSNFLRFYTYIKPHPMRTTLKGLSRL